MAEGIHGWCYLGAKVKEGTTLAEVKKITQDIEQADDEGYVEAVDCLLVILELIIKVGEKDWLVFQLMI